MQCWLRCGLLLYGCGSINNFELPNGKYIVEIGNSKHSLQVILTMVRDLILKGRKRCCCHIQETPNGISFKLAHQVKERKWHLLSVLFEFSPQRYEIRVIIPGLWMWKCMERVRDLADWWSRHWEGVGQGFTVGQLFHIHVPCAPRVGLCGFISGIDKAFGWHSLF